MTEIALPTRPATIRAFARALPAALVLISFVLGACSDSSGADAAGTPAALQVLDGDEQLGTAGEELADPLVAKVTDDRGRPVRGQLVNWRVTAGGGTVFAGSALTDEEGVARERWTLGTVAGAPQSVEARAVDHQSGQGIVFATFTATAKAGPATTLTASTTGTQEGTAGDALAEQIAVRASDQYGNPVAGQTITWEASGGGSAAPATSTTDAEGEARTTWTLGATAGTQQLTARSGSLAPATFAAVARAGGPARLEIVSGNQHDGTVGAPLGEGLVVRAADALGNGVPNVQVTWSVRSGGGTVSPATSTTNDAGIAQTVWTLGTTAGTQTAAASANGVADAVFTADALAGPPNAIAIVSGSDQSAVVGAQLPDPLVARVADRYGNPTPGVAVAWAIGAGGGEVSPSSGTTDDDGRASARWTVGSAGDGNRATATAAPGVVATFRARGLLGGAGRLINVGQSPSGIAEVFEGYGMRVQVVDGAGQAVAGAVVSWAAAGGGFAQPATSSTDANGYATSTWRLSKQPGQNTLTVSTLDLAPLTFAITARAGEACNAGVTYWSQDPLPVVRIGQVKEGISGSAFDYFGNPVAGFGFGSGISDPSEPLGQQARLIGSLVTDATGRTGVASMQAGTRAGQQTIYLLGRFCTGSEEAHSSRLAQYGVALMVLPDPPSVFEIVQGDNQVATTGTRLPNAPHVAVSDQYGNDVPNVPVVWTVESGGGTVQPWSEATDQYGEARTYWTLGPAVGEQRLRAELPNGMVVIFRATGTAP